METQHLRGCAWRCDNRRCFADCKVFAVMYPSGSISTTATGTAPFGVLSRTHKVLCPPRELFTKCCVPGILPRHAEPSTEGDKGVGTKGDTAFAKLRVALRQLHVLCGLQGLCWSVAIRQQLHNGCRCGALRPFELYPQSAVSPEVGVPGSRRWRMT